MSAATGQIIAIGGFTPDSPVAPIYRYILEQCREARPRVGFLATACGDAERSIERFYEITRALDCEPTHLPLFGRTPDPKPYLEAQHIVLVGGGNTKSMLAVWRDWGIDTLLRRRWRSGVILAGFSAGAICWFEQGVSDSWADELRSVNGIGLLSGSCCPHFDGEPERRPAYHRMVSSGEMSPGVAIEDDAVVHYVGTEIRCVVASRPGAGAFRVGKAGDSASEVPLEAPRVEISSGP